MGFEGYMNIQLLSLSYSKGTSPFLPKEHFALARNSGCHVMSSTNSVQNGSL